MMMMEDKDEGRNESDGDGMTFRRIAGYTAVGLGLAAAIGGAISIIPPAPEPVGPRPAYVAETQQTGHGNVIDMGNYKVTLPDDIPLQYGSQLQRGQKEWTILVYSAADNNLEGFQMGDVDEMERVGSNKYMDVVVQIDRGTTAEGQVDSGDRAWTGARRYYLTKDAEAGKLNSKVLAKLGQVNMGDPKTLADFVEWGVKNFPAKHYMLVISDHGAGWSGAIEDDSSGSYDLTSTVKIQQGISEAQKRTGVKVEVLGYDACLMASAEAAYQVRAVASYQVSSQELEGAEGWPYAGIMGNNALVVVEKFDNAFKGGPRPELTPKLMSFLIVKESEHNQKDLRTLSAVELERMPGVAQAVDGLAQALRSSKVPVSEFNTVAEGSQHFGQSWFGVEPLVDLSDLAGKLAADSKYEPAVRDAAKKVVEAVKTVVVAEQHNTTSHPNAHGLHIYVPDNFQGSYDKAKYEEMDFARDTRWDEFLQSRDKAAKP